MLRIAFKGTIDRGSFKPGYSGDVGDIVPTNGVADGMTSFGEIRFPQRFIYEIGGRPPRTRRWGSCASDRYFRHVPSKKV